MLPESRRVDREGFQVASRRREPVSRNRETVNVNWAFGKMRGTALHIACDRGYVKIVQLLLAADNIDVNVADVDGNRPIHDTAYNDKRACLALLLADTRVDVNAVNQEGLRALDMAILRGQSPIIKDLLLSGRQLNIDRDRLMKMINNVDYPNWHRMALDTARSVFDFLKDPTATRARLAAMPDNGRDFTRADMQDVLDGYDTW